MKSHGNQIFIDAVHEIINTIGVQGLSVRTIASKIDASTKLIYSRFGGLDNLKLYVLKTATLAWLKQAQSQLVLDGSQLISAYYDSFLAIYEECPVFDLFLDSSLIETNEFLEFEKQIKQSIKEHVKANISSNKAISKEDATDALWLIIKNIWLLSNKDKNAVKHINISLAVLF